MAASVRSLKTGMLSRNLTAGILSQEDKQTAVQGNEYEDVHLGVV